MGSENTDLPQEDLVPNADSIESSSSHDSVTQGELIEEQVRAQVERMHRVVLSSKYSGPLPPPSVLQAYGMVNPDFPERIFDLAERQASHRRELESVVVRADVRRANWGLASGFVVAVLSISLSAFLILNGHDLAGGTIGIGATASLVTAFIYGSNSRKEERLSKEQIRLDRTKQNTSPANASDEQDSVG